MRRQATNGAPIALAAIAAMLLVARLEIRGAAQTTSGRGTGVLMGVIVDALDNRPVADAEVKLGGATPAVSNTPQLTDAEGRFVFLDLPKGTFTITATKAGYADGAFGRRRPAGLSQTLALADGERIGELKIPIWKYGAITGTIRDEAGEPMIDVAVRVLQRTVVAGKRKLTPFAFAKTDDRGVYRISSLTPGDYVVAVPSTQASAPESIVDVLRNFRGSSSGQAAVDLYRDVFSGAMNLLSRPEVPKVGGLAFQSLSGDLRAGISPLPSSDGRLFVYQTMYHPSVPTAALAAPIGVRSGQEVGGVDVQLKLVPTSRVSGVVTGPDGALVVRMALALQTDDLSTDAAFETATTVSDAAGRFTFLGVPPGQYQLRATKAQVVSGGSRGGVAPPPPPSRAAGQPAPAQAAGPGFTLWADQPLAVETRDLDGLAISLRPGFRISGRADFSDVTAPDPDQIRRMYASVDPADARPLSITATGRTQFDTDGNLLSHQLPPGRYYLRLSNIPGGLTLKSAMWNGRDISNVPLTLDRDISGVTMTFTDRPAGVSGQVRNASGAPDASATVLIFPADANAWSGYGSFPRGLRSARVDRDGRYGISGLPAGDYLVVAVAEEESANWQDPLTLRALSRVATSLKLSDNEVRSQQLQTIAVPR